MRKYLFIPYSLLKDVISLQSLFLSQGNEAYVLLNPVYLPSAEPFRDENTNAFSQRSENIKMFQDIDGQIYKASGFSLEARQTDIDFIPTEILAQCKIFDSASEYLRYKESLIS